MQRYITTAELGRIDELFQLLNKLDEGDISLTSNCPRRTTTSWSASHRAFGTD